MRFPRRGRAQIIVAVHAASVCQESFRGSGRPAFLARIFASGRAGNTAVE